MSVTLRKGGAVTTVIDVPPRGFTAGTSPVLVLAHGAGHDLRSKFMEYFATQLAERGICVVRFNFPYREATGDRPPDRPSVLAEAYQTVVVASSRRTGCPPGPLFMGGKSLGAWVACRLVSSGRVRPTGLVLLGYPLHDEGKDAGPRVDALRGLGAPALFVQGDRDPLCDLDRLRPTLRDLRVRGHLHVVRGGDHSFRLPRAARREQGAAYTRIADTIRSFVFRS